MNTNKHFPLSKPPQGTTEQHVVPTPATAQITRQRVATLNRYNKIFFVFGSEFAVPAWSVVAVGNTGKFNDPISGEINWLVDAKFGGSGTEHAGMRITYTFPDVGVIQSAFIQEINRFSGDAGKVGLSCALAGNVSSNSFTVTCIRTDRVSPWSDNFSFLLFFIN